MDTAVSASQIVKSYGSGDARTTVLHGVDLHVEPGEMVFLLGPSGSGKSTLLSILGCILTPDSGEVQLLSQDVSQLTEHERADFRRRNIGFIFQRFHLFRGLNAWENVQVAFDLLGVPRSRSQAKSRALLGQVGMAQHANRHINQLSMGQLQRIAIARALAGSPRLILADEPTASLDAGNGRLSIRLLKDLAAQGIAVIVVTHDDRILSHADRVIHLEDGRIRQLVGAATH